MPKNEFQAVVFDLLTALLNSWSLWSKVAGSDEAGLAWRKMYLELTYQAGPYRPYEGIIEEAARNVGVTGALANELMQRWNEIEPWPETKRVLRALIEIVPVGIVTNSSIALADVAVACTGVAIPMVVTAAEAGYYKPHPQPYRMILERLECEAEKVLFVAGSASDVSGASEVGMPVFWHNRMNMPPMVSSPKPTYVSDSLLPILGIV
ncbi:MAG: HAD-IA family hydrolase [Gemmatimonadales bacterium]